MVRACGENGRTVASNGEKNWDNMILEVRTIYQKKHGLPRNTWSNEVVNILKKRGLNSGNRQEGWIIIAWTTQEEEAT